METQTQTMDGGRKHVNPLLTQLWLSYRRNKNGRALRPSDIHRRGFSHRMAEFKTEDAYLRAWPSQRCGRRQQDV